MPTYQYTCADCGNQLEVVQKFTDDSLTVCPTCEGALRKVFSAVGVVFKGSGFYRNDSREASEQKVGAGSSSSGSDGSASGSESGSSNSDSGSSSGSDSKETGSASSSGDAKSSSGSGGTSEASSSSSSSSSSAA